MSLWTPPHRPLSLPGRPRRRVVRRPDLRWMSTDRLSGAPLHANEVDYDDLIINRTWRAYENERPSEVRYFMYEFAQRNPGEGEHWHGYKAVRFARLTRVPRWLRQQGAGVGRPGHSQMAYVLAALREQGILFVQLVTKTPEIPLIFAYGVQAVGASAEEAQQGADEGYAALCGLLDGTFQQIEYAPISLDEAERIARYSATWREIAMARGRPMLSSESIGAAALLDGNRTDVEQTHNQMEAFIRGMTDSNRGFMMSLVTVPLIVENMTLAWRNVATKLSQVRSETHGMRAFTAGFALPLAVGNSLGSSHGDSHGTTASHGLGESAGQSHSLGYSESQTIAEGVSETHTHGVSQTVTDGVSSSQTVGESQSSSVGVSETDTTGVSASQQVGTGQSLSDSTSTSVAAGQSLSNSVSESWGESAGISEGRSFSESAGVSQSESIAAGRSVGESYSQSVSDARGASITDTQGVNSSAARSETQTLSLSNALADSLQNGRSFQSGTNVNGGLLGFGASGSSGSGESSTSGLTNTNTLGLSHAGGLTRTDGISASLAQGLSQTTTFGESSGVNTGQSLTATNSVGSSQSQTAGQSLSATHSQTASQGASMGIGQSLTETAGLGRSVGANLSASEGVGQSHSLAAGRSASESVGTSTSASTAASHSVAQGTSESVAQGASRTLSAGAGSSETAGTSAALSQNQALADAYTVAMSRQASHTGSLGVVPNFGVTVSKQTLDAAKQVVGDILEATMRRYIDGVEGGAYLYQLFLVTEDRETLMAGAALLKSAFWGPGSHQERLVQPFHMITDLDDPDLEVDDVEAERDRLLAHAQAFTSYRRREPVMEIIEPFRYSSYATCGELSAFARPPVAESLGLLAVHDSSPVMAMPADRQSRELTLGYLYNGERGKISDTKYGLDVSELTHVLLSGVTGAGKTTTLMRLLSELCHAERTVTTPAVPGGVPQSRTVQPSIFAIDWMRNLRHLGSIVEPVRIDPATGERRGRFQFFSVRDTELGAFTWNPLAVPDNGMNPVEWLNAMADNMVASWNLGEFGRSLIAEYLDRMYSANRLEPFELRPARYDDAGTMIRPALVLDPIAAEDLPADAIGVDPVTGDPVANVYTYPELSRLVGVHHLAIIVAAEIEAAATLEGGRMGGTSNRDRLQSLWRRISYYAPEGQLSDIITCDDTLDERRCLTLSDVVDPERGLVTVVEADGLDQANRRFILGSMLLAIYRKGLHQGEGYFNQDGKGLGLFVVVDEAHEVYASQGEDEDAFSSSTRIALYESLHRRARALGIRLIDVVQNPGDISEAITSNTATVFTHRVYAKADRDRIFSLLNWSNMLGQQLREYRFLGELPVGHCIARLSPQKHFLEAAPVHFVSEPAALGNVSNQHLATWAQWRDGIE